MTSNPFVEYDRQNQCNPAPDVVPITAGPGDLVDPSDSAVYIARALIADVAGTVTILTPAGRTRTGVPLQPGMNAIGARRVTAISTIASLWGVRDD